MDRFPPPPKGPPDPMARASNLAERMAKILTNEDVSDAALAVAILTSGVIHQYAADALKAENLLEGIRKLEDDIILRAFSGSATSIQ